MKFFRFSKWITLSLGTAIAVSAGAQSSTTATETTVAAAAPVNTTQAHLEEQIKISAPRKLKFALATASFAGMDGMNNGTGEVSSLHQIRADYKLSDSESIRANQYLTNSWSGQKNDLVVGDLYLQYARTKIMDLPLGTVLNGHVRTTLPVSDATRNMGQNLAARGGIEVLKKFNPDFSIGLNLIPTYNLQSKNSYEVTDPTTGAVSRKANSGGNFWYYLSGNWNISKKLSFVQDFGLMRYWYKADSERGISSKTKEFLYADTSLTYQFDDVFELGGGLSSYQRRDMLAQENDFAVYRTDETDYYVAGTMRF